MWNARNGLSRQLPHGSALSRGATGLKLTPALMLLLTLGLSACGPTVFADPSPLVVEGELPPPPPPEPVAPKRVEVTEAAIVIHEKIQFDLDRATIRPESHSLLDEIVAEIQQHPHIREISIEGHTCDLGTDDYNQRLSDQRAAAVRKYLTQHGIADSMLLSRGFGESTPLVANTSEENRETNRRVEFMITKQEPVTRTVMVDPKTGQEVSVAPTAGDDQGGN